MQPPSTGDPLLALRQRGLAARTRAGLESAMTLRKMPRGKRLAAQAVVFDSTFDGCWKPRRRWPCAVGDSTQFMHPADPPQGHGDGMRIRLKHPIKSGNDET